MLTTSKKLTKSGKERLPSVTWSDRMRNQFILAMKTKADGISCSTGFKSEEWTTITNDFNTRMDMTLTRQQLQNQHSTLKAGYSIYHSYLTQSGFGINNDTKLVTAEPAALRDYFAAHPKAKEYEFKPLMFYDLLHELFEGKVATGKYAHVFASPCASAVASLPVSTGAILAPQAGAFATPTPLIGVKRVFNPVALKEDEVDNVPEEDVFMDRDDSSDSDVEVAQQITKKPSPRL